MQSHILHVLYAINLMAAFLALLFQKYTDVKGRFMIMNICQTYMQVTKDVGQFGIKNTGKCDDIKITR